MSRLATHDIDYTDKDYESFRSMMIKELKVRMPEYTDLSQTDAGIVIIECLSKALDILSFYQDYYANESFLTTCAQRDNALKWANMLGYVPRNSVPSMYNQVFVLNKPLKDPYTIPEKTLIRTFDNSIETSVNFETVEDLVIPAGSLGNEKNEKGEYLYTVRIVQGVSVQGEPLGSSNGTPSQKFKLQYTPVIMDSVEVFVNEGYGFVKWQRVDTFIDSTKDSTHYRVVISDYDEAQIIFGNGVSGRIPAPYKDNIFSNYRVGGGSIGNVGANKITVLGANLGDISETFNPELPYQIGGDKDTLEEIKTYAPIAYRTRYGVITYKDYEDKVMENFKPDVCFASVSNDPENVDNCLVYILPNPAIYGQYENIPTQLKERLVKFFEDIQIAGTSCSFLDPEFLRVDITAKVIVKDTFVQEDIETQIRMYLEYLFEIGNYPFNTDLSLSELESKVITNVVGIKSFRVIIPSDELVTPSVSQVILLNSLTLEMSGGVTKNAVINIRR